MWSITFRHCSLLSWWPWCEWIVCIRVVRCASPYYIRQLTIHRVVSCRRRGGIQHRMFGMKTTFTLRKFCNRRGWVDARNFVFTKELFRIRGTFFLIVTLDSQISRLQGQPISFHTSCWRFLHSVSAIVSLVWSSYQKCCLVLCYLQHILDTAAWKMFMTVWVNKVYYPSQHITGHSVD